MPAVEGVQFPPNIPLDQGQLYRCILQDQVRPFWILRNAYLSSPRRIADILISLENKLLYIVKHVLDLTAQVHGQQSSFYVYATFQHLIFECTSILDTLAYLSREDLQLKVNGPAITLRSDSFKKEMRKKCMLLSQFLDTGDVDCFFALTKVFRDAYIHRASPDSVVRTSKDHSVYHVRLFNEDAEQYREIASKWIPARDAVRYDVNSQIELAVLPLAKLSFEYAILITNKVCASLPLAANLDPGQRDESARLGYFQEQVSEVTGSFNAVLQSMIA